VTESPKRVQEIDRSATLNTITSEAKRITFIVQGSAEQLGIANALSLAG
jgi:hypothetical protein